MEIEDSTEAATNKGFDIDSPSSDDDWDTDLEDSFNIDASDMLMERTYLAACEQLGVAPVSKFIKELASDKVDLMHYGVLDRGTKAICFTLQRNITVMTLNLSDNGIREIGAKALAELLEENCFITSLDISGNSIGVEGAKALGRMLKNNSSLRSVNFSNTCNTSCCVLPLLEGIRESFYLKALDLSYNNIDDHGASVLGSILSDTSSLESLNLSWNNITVQGAVNLLEGVRDCYTINELNLAWNRLSGMGTHALRSALEHNESLMFLDVTNCCIGLPGAKIIAKGLKRNRGLRVLRIGENPCLSVGVYALLRAVRRNPESALQELHLDNMALDKECTKELNELRQQRPDFKCTWQVSLQGGQASYDRSERPYPLDMFLKFARTNGLRMVDLFKRLSSKRDTLGEEAFVSGLKKMEITMTKAELRKVFAILDDNGDGQLQFHEFPNLVSVKFQQERAAAKRKSTKNGKPVRK